jgi:putative CocE/NonD family hydrolase
MVRKATIEETDLFIPMSDGVSVAVRIRRPDDTGPVPALFAASPYRYDNDDLPETGVFLWRETGPIDWYVEHGFAYIHLDVRGTGKSEGEYGFFDRRERRDLFEVIEWIARQPWSNGNVGGIGHSYYAASQWCMAGERPPHLKCIAPYDGHVDFCSGWAYTGGVPSNFLNEWWNNNVRPINRFPANGAPARELPFDLPFVVSQHAARDGFWEQRSIHEALREVTIPVYSIGVWAKLDLHLSGNIMGYERVRGPRKLLVSGAPSMSAALMEFESIAFHERVLLPFYQRYLCDAPAQNDAYESRPAVQFALRGTADELSAEQWPPPEMRHVEWFFNPEQSASVTSLNDGSLTLAPASGAPSTSFAYPDPEWTLGPVVFTRSGPDPVRRVLTFTTGPLESDVTIAGAPELVLHASSSRADLDVIVKLSEQQQQPAGANTQPPFTVITKGWLRASHRGSAADDRIGAPVMLRSDPLPLEPGEIVELRVPLVATAYRARAGSRLRLELANADSPVTDFVFAHSYTPDSVGTATIYHDRARPSRLILPVLPPPEPPS